MENGGFIATVDVPRRTDCDGVDTEPERVLGPHVPLPLGVSQVSGPEGVSPAELHSFCDAGKADGVHTSSNEEEVELLGEVLLVEEELGGYVKEDEDSIGRDRFVSKMDYNERDGG